MNPLAILPGENGCLRAQKCGPPRAPNDRANTSIYAALRAKPFRGIILQCCGTGERVYAVAVLEIKKEIPAYLLPLGLAQTAKVVLRGAE